MALRGGSLELIQAAAFRFLDPRTFEVTEDVLLNFDDKAAASGGCPTATVHDSGPSVACGLGSSRFVSEPEDPSSVAVDQPVVGGGCPPMIACFNKTAVSPPPAVNAGTPTLPPAFLAQVHKDPFLVPCLPPGGRGSNRMFGLVACESGERLRVFCLHAFYFRFLL